MALEAAEAGVENAFGGVIAGTGGSGAVPSTNASYNVANTNIGGTTNTYQVPYLLDNGEVATIDMTGVSVNRNFRLCWGKAPFNGGREPAVEVMVYYSLGGVMKVARNGYDRGSRGGFASANSTGGNCASVQGYNFEKLVHFRNGTDNLGVEAGGQPVFLRVRMLYNDKPEPLMIILNGGNLPVQGKDIVSVGQAGSSNQKIHATAANPDLPSIFDTAIFSGTELTK